MKNLIFLALFISVMVFLMSLSIFVFYVTPVKEEVFQTSVSVTTDTGGFDLNSTAVTFGSIALGGSSTRTIFINNSYAFPVKVKPVVEGSISELVIYDSLIIPPNSASKFSLTAYANQKTSLGNYSGNISVKLFRL